MVQNEVPSNTDLFSASKDVFSGTRAETDANKGSSFASLDSTSTPPTNQNAFADMFGGSSESKAEPAIDLANLSNLGEPKEDVEDEKEDVKVISY